jgi:ribosomal RNA-processing protein 12
VSTGNAFDDILYNSDSDLSSDEDADGDARRSGKQRQPVQKTKGGAYLRNEGDEPMDLLSRGIAARFASELLSDMVLGETQHLINIAYGIR